MNVDSILRSKGNKVETVPPSMSVYDVCGRLYEIGIGAMVVSSDGRHVEGIVSERDVIRLIARSGADVLDKPVSDIMSRDVYTCERSDDVATLMEVMTDRRIRHLPVIEEHGLVGIVSIGDLVKRRIRESEQEATALREYISTG